VFLADVHLGASSRAEVRFREFLRTLPLGVTIVSLGDLVDAWAEGSSYDFAHLYPLLAALRDRPNFHIPGNRDFLVGPRWTALTGGEVLGDAARIRVRCGKIGQTLLCLHGDTLLTADRRYRLWRRIARSSVFRALAGGSGHAVADRLAKTLRHGSRAEVARKPRSALNIDRAEAERLLERADADAVVCGHTHAAERSRLGKGEIIVLGAWDQGGEVLLVDERGLQFAPPEELDLTGIRRGVVQADVPGWGACDA
jgi:UDP-2,3-diacylglucosamine hydrolase